MLRIDNLSYRIEGRVLLDGTSASIPAGHKVGLVGRNGSGKSTLLRLIAGEIEADGGKISKPKASRLGFIAQEAPSGPASLIDTVLAADTERAALEHEAEHVTDPNRIAEIHHRLADIGAYQAPARAASILAGLGFSETEQQSPVSGLSGGWRMRVALAAALFSEPDILLLDEPTNHLDLEAALWLESYLAKWPHTLLLVSHDRNLLNSVPKHILHLTGNQLTLYGGNYDIFEKNRREHRQFAANAFTKQAAQRKHMESYVERFRYKANKARQAQSKLKALARMETLEPVVEDRPVNFDFPEPAELAPPLISLEKATAGYGGPPVLKGLNLRIDMDDRIALLGANGNGKSTLAKIISGRLKLETGTLSRHRKLRVGYFAQHQLDELRMNETPYDHMAALMPKSFEPAIRAQLGRFDFGKAQADTKVGDLSGGEKARLMLALITHDAPHILVLDEPTNHLDIDRRDALVQALNTYSGAVILVTHDPHLVELIADHLWLVADGKVVPYDGDMADYRRVTLKSRRQSSAKSGTDKSTPKTKEGKQPATKRRRENADLTTQKKAVEKAEKRLAELNAARLKIEAALTNLGLYTAEKTDQTARIAELTQIHTRLSEEISTTEESWLEAQQELET